MSGFVDGLAVEARKAASEIEDAEAPDGLGEDKDELAKALRSLSEEDVLYNDYTPRAVVGVSLFLTTPLGPLRLNFTEPLLAEEQDETQSFDVTVSTRF